MKILLNDRRFINRRYFCDEQAPSTVFTITLSALSVVQQIPQETKHRDIISRSTSNNSSQAQERNLRDVLVRQLESK